MILADDVIERAHRLSVEVVRRTGRGYFQVREDTAEADLGTGYGLYAGPDSPLTQVVGFAHRKPGDVQEIERFFSARAENWEITVTPFTDAGTFRELLELGYRPGQFEGELAQWVGDVPDEDVEIREVRGELAVFMETTGRGWTGNEGDDYVPGELERAVSKVEARRYIAFVDGLPAAAASMIEVGDSVVLGGGTARVPFRGRGLQSALLRRRLRDAGKGRFALMGAVPGTTSYRNAQRAGFTPLYSKVALMRH
ncbi:hypothetical protein EON82_06065 [bacterium]|nr:MAG: hypothetical protein EON82_06065 [bacterium]